jgi:hypothetical protein
MQTHYYVVEIVLDGVGDINFVPVFIIVRIDYHLMNDGLSIVMLTSKVVGGLSSISVFLRFISMNTINNVLFIVASVDEQKCLCTCTKYFCK